MNNTELLKYSKQLNILFFRHSKKIEDEFNQTLQKFFHKIDIVEYDKNSYLNFSNYFLNNYDLVLIHNDTNIDNTLSNIVNVINNDQIIIISEYLDNSIIKYINYGIKDYIIQPFDIKKLETTFFDIVHNRFAKSQSKVNFQTYVSSILETEDTGIDFHSLIQNG